MTMRSTARFQVCHTYGLFCNCELYVLPLKEPENLRRSSCHMIELYQLTKLIQAQQPESDSVPERTEHSEDENMLLGDLIN